MVYLKWLCKFSFCGKVFNLALQGGLHPAIAALCNCFNRGIPTILVSHRFLDLPEENRKTILIHEIGHLESRSELYADYYSAMFVGTEQVLDTFDRVGVNNTLRRLHVKNLNLEKMDTEIEVLESCEDKSDTYGYNQLLWVDQKDAIENKSFFELVTAYREKSIKFNHRLAHMYSSVYELPTVKLYTVDCYSVIAIYKKKPSKVDYLKGLEVTIFIDPMSSSLDVAEAISNVIHQKVTSDDIKEVNDPRLNDWLYKYMVMFGISNLYDKAKSLGVEYVHELDKLL